MLTTLQLFVIIIRLAWRHPCWLFPDELVLQVFFQTSGNNRLASHEVILVGVVSVVINGQLME